MSGEQALAGHLEHLDRVAARVERASGTIIAKFSWLFPRR